MMLLADKVVMLTGAASGIGAAAARLFAAEGARLALVDRDGDGVARVAAEVGGLALTADVGADGAMERAVADTLARFGRLDGAFDNAGVEQRGAAMIALADYPVDDFDRVAGVNLRGLLLSMKAQIPAMLAGGGGAVVVTASILGAVGAPGMAAYAASKHGAVGLVRAAALDYARRGVRVNALLPGAVRTPMLTERAFPANPGYEAHASAGNPMGRMAEPNEVAEAAAWLLSDRASYVTGACLAVDGGFTAV